MAQVSFGNRQVSCKIVYYGPGLSGKTTNIEMVHQKVPVDHRGELTSIATEGDRTLFFDFMPLDLGNVAGMQTKFQLYTVPGQVYYNATRKLVLRGADGVVFVADSAPDKMDDNLVSMANLEENLAEQGLSLDDVPMVIQFNKRDLPNAVGVALLESRLNRRGVPCFEAVASKGEGVLPTLKALAKLVLDRLNERYGARSISASVAAAGVREVPLRPAQPVVASAVVGEKSAATATRPAVPMAPISVAAVAAMSTSAPRPVSKARRPARGSPAVTMSYRHKPRGSTVRLVVLLVGVLAACGALGVLLWYWG